MTKDGSGGRPINANACVALKAAALRLLRHKTYDKVSIADIAQEAGVARQTLYNRWNTKADLVLEAVFDETRSYAAEPDKDDPRHRRVVLEEFLINVFNHVNAHAEILRALIAAAQLDRSFHDTFFTKFVLPRERMVTALLLQAQERGEFSKNRDPKLVSGFIHGAFWYRLLNRGTLEPKLAKEILSEIFDSHHRHRPGSCR